MSEAEKPIDPGATSEASDSPAVPLTDHVPAVEHLQFRKAEHAAEAGIGPPCVVCKKRIVNTYYHAQGQVVCPNCAQKIQSGQAPPPAHTLLKSFLYGLGAALAGTAIFSIVWIVSNSQWALISILIGYMVGKAVRYGSKGLGGRPQQILAVLLTYFSISMSILPVVLYHQLQKPKSVQASAVTTTPSNPDATSTPHQAVTPNAAKPKPSLSGVLLVAIGLGLASPFLALKAGGFGGLLTLLIIFFGLQRAWHLTGRSNILVMGPYELGSS